MALALTKPKSTAAGVPADVRADVDRIIATPRVQEALAQRENVYAQKARTLAELDEAPITERLRQLDAARRSEDVGAQLARITATDNPSEAERERLLERRASLWSRRREVDEILGREEQRCQQAVQIAVRDSLSEVNQERWERARDHLNAVVAELLELDEITHGVMNQASAMQARIALEIAAQLAPIAGKVEEQCGAPRRLGPLTLQAWRERHAA